jgi:hypothetical protein
LGAFGFAGGAGRAAEENKLQAEIIPVTSGNNFHEIKFNFYRIVVLG